MRSTIKRLEEFDEKIKAIAREFGLDFFPQEFDVIPAQKMHEIMAYNFPVNFSHWSFGRDYELERTKYEHGFGIPYEVVLNSNPSRAYLMKTNPFAVQVMVMAHVYAHNDFMKNNRYFSPTRRDMLSSATEAAERFRAYEREYGLNNVEQHIDAALSINLNIDPNFFIKEETDDEIKERLTTPLKKPRRGKFDDLIPPKRTKPMKKQEFDRKLPPEPDRDVLLFISRHSPLRMQAWERDVLETVRAQARYVMPNIRTKIMNEGWATYWHIKIMERLFKEGDLNEADHGDYNISNSLVLASNPRALNPYLVGYKMFKDIERRWDKGQFGQEWEDSKDPKKHENWDTRLVQGRDKIFEVRSSYNDRFFIEEFLTEKLARDLKLYLYEGRDEPEERKYVVKEKNFEIIKQMLVKSMGIFSFPVIYVTDGDYKGRSQLILEHAHEGIELDPEYREKTLEHIFYLWGRPVHIKTVKNKYSVTYSYDGHQHTQSSIDVII